MLNKLLSNNSGAHKNRTGKRTTFAIALTLVLTLSTLAAVLPAAQSHDPAWQIPTFAKINVAPDPVGVGQDVVVVFWLGNAPYYNAAVNNNYRFHNYKVTITAPDGSTEVKDFPYISDSTNSQYFIYTPTTIGTYTFFFEYPGETITVDDQPPGSAYVGDIYLASSAQTTLTVQQQPVGMIQSAPLPLNYWTRPINGQNTNWDSIASNYLRPEGAAYSFGSVRLQPDGVAPNSPHIMWTYPINAGGIVGGNNGYQEPNSPSAGTGITDATFYTGLSYETRFNNPIIINGRLYYRLPLGNNGQSGPYICQDIRTGEEIWSMDLSATPSFGVLVTFESPNQHGVIPSGYLVATSGTTWIMYDAWTGNWLFNITNVPRGTMDYGPSGEPIIYVMDVANGWLALWNFTDVISNGPEAALVSSGYRPVGQVFDTNERNSYSWNVTIPALPSSAAIAWAIYNDKLFGYANTRSTFGQPTFGGVFEGSSTVYATFWAISLKPGTLGQLLWTKDVNAPPGNITMQLGTVDPQNNVFLISTKETMQWYGYSLTDGSYLWGPIGNTRAFNYFPTIGSGGVAQIGYVAYNNFYVGGYGGEIFCYDTKTGNLIWSYGGGGAGNSTNSELNSPWGLYPTFVGGIADGKVYVYSGEHSPNVPPYKGEEIRCLNATTGKEIWTMTSWASVGGFSDYGFPIADGELCYLNVYDMQVYALGQGPTKTTVNAPDRAVSAGEPVIVTGTVMDISAGTQQNEQKANFPDGVPCASDESMGDWMEYVYQQQPHPTDFTGVQVILTVVDPNNNQYEVGRATTDISGTYGALINPPVPGLYKLTATFIGNNGYYASSATTYFAVS
jgi:outer membrane protein assembly factor BamB